MQQFIYTASSCKFCFSGGDTLAADLTVGGFAASSHDDTDLGEFTVCSTYDGVGEGAATASTNVDIVGGFMMGGWFIPLGSGAVFAFDAKFPHAMCADDVVTPGAVRWSTAAFLAVSLLIDCVTVRLPD